MITGSAAYSQPVQKLIQGLLTQRTDSLRSIGAGVADIAPYGGLLGASYGLNQ
jgi:hypothetical protein